MPQIIELPDGQQLEFPDEMDDFSIKDVIKRKFPQFNKAAAAPEIDPLAEARRAGYTPSWEEDTGTLRGAKLPATPGGRLKALGGAARAGYQAAMGAWPAYVLDPIAAAFREGRLPRAADIGSGAFMSNVGEDIMNAFPGGAPQTLGQARLAAGLETGVQLATDPLNVLEITNPFALTAMGLEGAYTAQEQAEIPSTATTPEEALMEQARLEQMGGMAVVGAGAGATTGMTRAHAQVGKWNRAQVERLAAEQAARLARERELMVPPSTPAPDPAALAREAAQRAATEAFMQRRAAPDFEQELAPPPFVSPGEAAWRAARQEAKITAPEGDTRATAIGDILMEERLGRRPEPPPPPPVQDVDFIAPEQQGPPPPLAPSGELEQVLSGRVSRLRGLQAPKKWNRANIMGTMQKMLEPAPEDIHAALKARVAELAEKGATDFSHYFADEDAYRAAYEAARDEALRKGTTVEALYPDLAAFEDQAGLLFKDATVAEQDLTSRNLEQRRTSPILAGTEFENIGKKPTAKQRRLGMGHLTIQELRKAVRDKSGPLYKRALRAMKEKMLADAAEQWEARVSEEERLAPPPDADMVRDSVEPEGPVDASFDPTMLEEGAPKPPRKPLPPGEGPSGPLTMREGAVMNLAEAHNDMRVAERLYKAGKLTPMSYIHAGLRNIVNEVTSMLPEGLKWDREAAERFQRTQPRLARPTDAQGATAGHRIGRPEVSFNPEHGAWTYVLRTLEKGGIPTPSGFVQHMLNTVGHELGHASSAASHELIMAPPDSAMARTLGVGEENRFRTSADIATQAVRESAFAQGMLAAADQPGSTLYGALQKLINDQMPEAVQAIADVKAGRKRLQEGGGLRELAASEAAAIENAIWKVPTQRLAQEAGAATIPAPDIGQQGRAGVETPQQRLEFQERGRELGMAQEGARPPIGYETFLQDAASGMSLEALRTKYNAPPEVKTFAQLKEHLQPKGAKPAKPTIEPPPSPTAKPKVQFKKKEEYPAPLPPGQRNLFSPRVDVEKPPAPPKPTQGALFEPGELRTGLKPEELAALPDKRQKALFEEDLPAPTPKERAAEGFDIDLEDPVIKDALIKARSLRRIEAGEHLNDTLRKAGKAEIPALRTTQQNNVAATIVADLEAGKLPRTYEAVLKAAQEGMGRVGGRATAVAQAVADRYALKPKKLSSEAGATTLGALKDVANMLARGANNVAEGLLVATASGLDTAVNNLVNGLVHQGVNAISDMLMAAVGNKEAAARLPGYLRAGKDVPAFAVAGVGRFTNKRSSRNAWVNRAFRDTEDARAITAIGLDPKLYHRIWNHTVAMGPNAPLTGAKERLFQHFLAPNIISDHATFMTTFTREMQPTLKRLGVRNMGELKRLILRSPAILDHVRDDILFSATEGARAAFKLGPAGYSPDAIKWSKATEKVSQILTNYPALQLVTMKFSNYILNNMFPYILDSLPLAGGGPGRGKYLPMAGARTKLSMDYPTIKREYEASMLQTQRMRAQLDTLRLQKRSNPAIQPQYDALKQQLTSHIKHTEGVRADYRRAQRVGVYRRSNVTRQESAGLLLMGIFAMYGMTTANPEEAWDKLTFGQTPSGDKVKKSIVPALGALAPFAYAGYRIAQHARGVPDAVLSKSKVNMRDDIEQMFGARTAEWPTVLTALFGEERYLDELYKELDKSGFSQGKILVQPWPFDIMRFLGKMVDPRNRMERSPKLDTPREGGPLTIAGRFATDVGTGAATRMPWSKLPFPKKYDPFSGKPSVDLGGWFLRDQAFSPLREFVDNNKNLISPKEVWFTQTGAEKWDEAAFAYIRDGIERRVNPIIAGSAPVEQKAAEIQAEMRRIKEEANRIATRTHPTEAPSSVVRRLTEEEKRKEMEKKSRVLGKRYKAPGAARPLTPSEKRRVLENDRIASPPS